ncbi:uncharacterized protein BJ212DRAFT_346762 [Suillus subaureus]|uniref:GPI ethanolamine phosphate transferase 2 n=1 Tax=Suillus subaureus TaxID=48587 RepID=A0A9P7E9H0_9AGAM|nr:uncharacterized protein BJ212DRAFT_346762 [Suillus subaureus]KAG1814681.1 hypothetical protein BJ212DRAFT_346762 [Suillus subaureus]
MTLLPLAILLLLRIQFVCSLLPGLNGDSITTLDVSDSPSSNNTRTLWDIIWSCAATLFACTWTAIHPNIPGMDEGKFTVLSRRLGMMMMALIAPELLITWATCQFLSACDAAKAFNDTFDAQLHQTRDDCPGTGESTATLLNEIPISDGRNSPHPSASQVAVCNFREWTITQGFFAWMGGFMLYYNGKPRVTLTPKELERFVHESSVEVPIIVDADIEDRSKGDALSKGIAVLQLAWFVLQLVARYVQNLPITLLEVDTLALAALTSIAYGFWWKKPKDVRRPHAVYWKATAPPPSNLAYGTVNAEFFAKNPGVLPLSYIYAILSLAALGPFNSPHAVHSRRVPSVGGYDQDSVSRRPIIVLLIGCFSAAVFGGIHCLGWNYLFRWHAEQILWRTASLAIVLASVSNFLLFGSILMTSGLNGLKETFKVSKRFIAFEFATSCIYSVARLTLAVLMLMSFRSLPPGTYDTVAWTRFIPHL